MVQIFYRYLKLCNELVRDVESDEDKKYYFKETIKNSNDLKEELPISLSPIFTLKLVVY